MEWNASVHSANDMRASLAAAEERHTYARRANKGKLYIKTRRKISNKKKKRMESTLFCIMLNRGRQCTKKKVSSGWMPLESGCDNRTNGLRSDTSMITHHHHLFC